MHICKLCSAGRRSLLPSRLRETQGVRVYTTAPALASAGLRGGRFGLQSRASWFVCHGIAFRRARAYQAHGSPKIQVYISKTSLRSAAVYVSVSATSTTPASATRRQHTAHTADSPVGWVAQPRSRASARKCNFQLTAQLTAD